jgi:hypothetical protein
MAKTHPDAAQAPVVQTSMVQHSPLWCIARCSTGLCIVGTSRCSWGPYGVDMYMSSTCSWCQTRLFASQASLVLIGQTNFLNFVTYKCFPNFKWISWYPTFCGLAFSGTGLAENWRISIQWIKEKSNGSVISGVVKKLVVVIFAAHTMRAWRCWV